MLFELLVYPIVSLVVILIVFRLLRPAIVSRNIIVCLIFSLIVYAVAAAGFLIIGSGFVWGAAHNWSNSMFVATYVLFLIGLLVVPIAAAYWTYRRIRGGTRH